MIALLHFLELMIGKLFASRALFNGSVSLLPIRPHEPGAVEVHHVVWGVGTPRFSFPCELCEVLLHGFPVGEAGNEYGFVPLIRKQAVELGFPRNIHRTVRACRFHEEQPPASLIPCDDVGRFLSGAHADAELVEQCGIDRPMLVVGVVDVRYLASGGESGEHFLDNRFDKKRLPAGRQVKCRAGGQLYRCFRHMLTFFGEGPV